MNRKLLPLATMFCTVCCLALVGSCQATPMTIAHNGKSTFSIVVPKVAAVSVNDAAKEMRQDIEEATDVKLPVIKDDQTINGPFISLGATKQAKKADITTKGLAYDAFHTMTKGGNLYIIGIDTTTETSRWTGQGPRKTKQHPEIPGPAYTNKGGFSNGTANGVYSFLENHLGVRWLFPGNLGRVVPSKNKLTLGAINRAVTPAFNYRTVSQARYKDSWWRHQKLSYSINVNYVHAFHDIAPASMWKKHPEWFAMNSKGDRPKPSNKNYKLETTNQELVKYTANKAIEALKKNPHQYSFSISPSDGLGWSQSPASQALTLPPKPDVKYPYIVTPLVLKWYRDVSAIVAKKYPQGRIVGFLYSAYRQPLEGVDVKFPSNFIPMYTGNAGGYKYYQKSFRQRRKKMMEQWAKVAPKNWYYYGNMTWMRQANTMVTPPAPMLINFAFNNMVDGHMKGGEVYGSRFWSQGAIKNYILAKMMWHPTSDAAQLEHDWLMHAYGVKAASVMSSFYSKLDQWWSDYANGPHYTKTNTSEELFRYNFAPHYPEMEKMFRKAWEQPMTKRQRKRLDLIRQNMIVLQFRLHNAGYLPEGYTSPLTRSAEQVYDLFTSDKKNHESQDSELGFKVFSNILHIARRDQNRKPVKVSLEKAAATKTSPIPNPGQIVLYASKDQTVHIKPSDVHPGSALLFYYLQYVDGDKTNLLKRGILASGNEITFDAKAGRAYYFRTYIKHLSNPSATWKIRIRGAVNTTGRYFEDDNTLYMSPQGEGSLYAFVPDEMPLQARKEGNDLIVHTETEKAATNRHQLKMQQVAKNVLKNALQKHDATQVEDLNHKWRFTTDAKNQGQSKGYYTPGFNDSSWKNINVLDYWQNQGFSNYHGTAWYRKAFNISRSQADPTVLEGKQLILFFGNIDGDAAIYFNGEKIGTYRWGKQVKGYDHPIVYNVTDLVRYGKNTIAVKVTKGRMAAGLYRGVSILKGVMLK